MQKHEEAEFKEVLIGLGEYYNKPITEALTKIYWYDLKPLTIDQFKQLASYHRMHPDFGAYFPKTSDFIRYMSGTGRQIEQAIEDKAENAWSIVLNKITTVGSYGKLILEDQQALAAVKSIGTWPHICSLPMDKLTWAKKEFIANYKNYERTPLDALPLDLPGRTLIENEKKKGNSLTGGTKSLHNLINNNAPRRVQGQINLLNKEGK